MQQPNDPPLFKSGARNTVSTWNTILSRWITIAETRIWLGCYEQQACDQFYEGHNAQQCCGLVFVPCSKKEQQSVVCPTATFGRISSERA